MRPTLSPGGFSDQSSTGRRTSAVGMRTACRTRRSCGARDERNGQGCYRDNSAAQGKRIDASFALQSIDAVAELERNADLAERAALAASFFTTVAAMQKLSCSA